MSATTDKAPMEVYDAGLDRALSAAHRYANLDERGDVVLRDQERRTIEMLVGRFGDGHFQLPYPVAAAMGRPDLGPRYELHATHLDWNGDWTSREILSAHYTRDGAEAALSAQHPHRLLRIEIKTREGQP